MALAIIEIICEIKTSTFLYRIGYSYRITQNCVSLHVCESIPHDMYTACCIDIYVDLCHVMHIKTYKLCKTQLSGPFTAAVVVAGTWLNPKL